MRARLAPLLAAVPVLLLATVALTPRAARACSCMRPGPPLESAEAAAVVFEGRASGPVIDGMQHTYTFEITRSFKGDAGTQAEILTRGSSAACGRRFEAGELYLVYASRSDGRLRDGLCSRTRRSTEATEDFAALGEGSPVAADPSPGSDTTAAEPPRIEDPAGPPPASPSARGCAVDVTGMPHGPQPRGFAMLMLLGVASMRRRAYRGVRTPRRQHVARSLHDSPPRQ